QARLRPAGGLGYRRAAGHRIDEINWIPFRQTMGSDQNERPRPSRRREPTVALLAPLGRNAREHSVTERLSPLRRYTLAVHFRFDPSSSYKLLNSYSGITNCWPT